LDAARIDLAGAQALQRKLDVFAHIVNAIEDPRPAARELSEDSITLRDPVFGRRRRPRLG
jgi:hypothetical protein